MAVYDHNNDQISMENGDDWYFDQFGEYRNANAESLESDSASTSGRDNQAQSSDAEDLADPGQSINPEDEFHETLQSEHINDQLNDPNLQREAESDYQDYSTNQHESIGDKIKDKFNDLTGK